jgi:hypothetical protein
MVKQDAAAIFFCWESFLFWFEYKTIGSKGQVRVLGN